MSVSRSLASTLFAAFVAALVVMPIACLDPTQLTLELHTDVPCSSVRGVSITVGSSPEIVENAKPGTTAQSCNADGFIGTIAVAPAGASNGRIAIRAVLGVDVPADQCTPDNNYVGCIVVRRELAFVPHRSLLVPIKFYSVCRNVACTGTSTCKGTEGCVDSGTDPGTAETCKTAADCPVVEAIPSGCATPVCDAGRCTYVAKDADGDNDRSSNCTAVDSKVSIRVGTDCDDNDPEINGAKARPCKTPCAGQQACENGKVGACATKSPTTFSCEDTNDSDCNGVLDVDELAPILAADKGKLCANLYRCGKGTVQPERIALCRAAGGQYILDCKDFASTPLIGYVPVTGTASPGSGAAFLYSTNGKDLVYPYNVPSTCCPGGLCGGSQFCDGNTPLRCGVTTLVPAL